MTKEVLREKAIASALEKENASLRSQVLALKLKVTNLAQEIETRELGVGRYESLAVSVGRLCDEKNEAYGNTGSSTGKVLEYFYPNGVMPSHYNRMLILARMFDKIARLSNLGGGRRALGEDAARDLVGYALVLCGALEQEEP